jgi:acetyl-CoA carboxylase biotin carboxylase subunit
MEINCRIQVEHPVTEMVTGVDLVREQLLVAKGHQLGLTQADAVRRGAAIECRINAEDPARNFMPTPGLVEEFVLPQGPFTRVDTYGRGRFRVAAEYDPLIAKVITWGPDRDQALARMERALREVRVTGAQVQTTVPFLAEVLAHPLFRDSKHTTSLVDQMIAEDSEPAMGGAA